MKLIIALTTNTGRTHIPVQTALSLANAMQLLEHHTAELKCFGGLRIDSVRLQAVKYAREQKADVLLFVDDDMTFLPDAFHNLLERMDTENADIVSALYHAKDYPHNTYIMPVDAPDWLQMYVKGQVYRVRSIGTGLVAIKMSVFDKIPKPAFVLRMDCNGDITQTEDCYFAGLCHAAGLTILVDTNIRAEHLRMIEVPKFFESPNYSFAGLMDQNDLAGYGMVTKETPEPVGESPKIVPIQSHPTLSLLDGVDLCAHRRQAFLSAHEVECQACHETQKVN